MSKFKVDDRVKIKKSSEYYDRAAGARSDSKNPIKTEGTVVLIDSWLNPIKVEWDNGTYNTYEEEDLKLIKQKASEEPEQADPSTPAPGTKYEVLVDLCLWSFGKGDILIFKGADRDGTWEFEGIDTSCEFPQWLPQHHITSTLRELEVVSEESVEPTFVVGNQYKVISGQDGSFHHFSLGEIVTCIKVYQGTSTSGNTEGNVITKGDFESSDLSSQILYPEHVEVIVEGLKEKPTKSQTPFERKGYTEDTVFKVIAPQDTSFVIGDLVKLSCDDGTEMCCYKRISDDCRMWTGFEELEVYVEQPKAESPWIEWKGGEMPVPKGTLVDVKHQDGEVFYSVEAGEYGYARTWSYMYSDCEGNIIAYRLSDNASVTSSEALQDTLGEKVGASIASEQSAVKGLVEPCSTSSTKASELKGEDLVVGESYIVTSKENWGFTLGDTIIYVGKDTFGWKFQGIVDERPSQQHLSFHHGSPYRVKKAEHLVEKEFLIVGDKYKVIKTGCRAGWFFDLGDIVTFEGGGRFRGEKYPQYLSGDNLINIKDSVEKVEIPKVAFDEISEELRAAITRVLKDKLGARIETTKAYDPLDVKVTIGGVDIKGFSDEPISVGYSPNIEAFYKLNIGNLDLNNLTYEQLSDLYEKIEEVL